MASEMTNEANPRCEASYHKMDTSGITEGAAYCWHDPCVVPVFLIAASVFCLSAESGPVERRLRRALLLEHPKS